MGDHETPAFAICFTKNLKRPIAAKADPDRNLLEILRQGGNEDRSKIALLRESGQRPQKENQCRRSDSQVCCCLHRIASFLHFRVSGSMDGDFIFHGVVCVSGLEDCYAHVSRPHTGRGSAVLRCAF